MFTGIFGLLLLEKFYPVKGSQQTVELDIQWLSKDEGCLKGRSGNRPFTLFYSVRRCVFARYS